MDVIKKLEKRKTLALGFMECFVNQLTTAKEDSEKIIEDVNTQVDRLKVVEQSAVKVRKFTKKILDL